MTQLLAFEFDPDVEVWTSEIAESKADWLVGLPVEIATQESAIREQWIDEIRSFIYFLEVNLPTLKAELLSFFNQSLDWITERCEQWDCELPEDPTATSLWETLENFLICFKDRFYGGPSVSLLSECEWQPDGGIQITFENGRIGYIGQPE